MFISEELGISDELKDEEEVEPEEGGGGGRNLRREEGGGGGGERKEQEEELVLGVTVTTPSVSFKERRADLMRGECVDGFDDHAALGAEREAEMMPRCESAVPDRDFKQNPMFL
ncbi:hypothetical protein EYF80_030558 [Liparis tanakae]|uniref:Uncharacterized protein n=1 Tax=Liparis tanakae TaxID=230148 RepID=A0A4Z2H1H6_9TELE|nr:hypothetical protein EYF80_030558 [Liparis tanakae]